jgi:hypothetical protein
MYIIDTRRNYNYVLVDKFGEDNKLQDISVFTFNDHVNLYAYVSMKRKVLLLVNLTEVKVKILRSIKLDNIVGLQTHKIEDDGAKFRN